MRPGGTAILPDWTWHPVWDHTATMPTTPTPRRHVNLRLDPDVHAALKASASAHDRSVNREVAAVLRADLTASGHLTPSETTLLSDGQMDMMDLLLDLESTP